MNNLNLNYFYFFGYLILVFKICFLAILVIKSLSLDSPLTCALFFWFIFFNCKIISLYLSKALLLNSLSNNPEFK